MLINETKELKTIKILEEVDQMKESVYSAVKFSVDKGFNSVWNNQELTPQEVFNIMGTKAGYSLNLSKFAQLFLKAVNPEYQFLVPNKEYVVNEDGTVTVNAEPAESEING